MNEPLRQTPPTTGRGRRTSLAVLSALLFAGISLYASRAVSPGPATAGAGDEKGEEPRAPTPRAVAVATAFLNALDAKGREKALYEFDSAKKPNWSNLPGI